MKPLIELTTGFMIGMVRGASAKAAQAVTSSASVLSSASASGAFSVA